MFDRKKEIQYAYEWWNKRNPQFYNFDEIGGDCTNFVSQCLYFGGIMMTNNTNFGWYYKNLSMRAYSWTGVEEFYNFAINNKSNFGPRCKLVTISEIEIGDIVQMLQIGDRFHHNMIITKIDGKPTINSIYITCHTNDAKDKRLSDYNYQKIRFLKILNN